MLSSGPVSMMLRFASLTATELQYVTDRWIHAICIYRAVIALHGKVFFLALFRVVLKLVRCDLSFFVVISVIVGNVSPLSIFGVDKRYAVERW